MMKDLKRLDKDTLIDMLSKFTNQFMKLFREGATQQEYLACKEMMDKLTQEIAIRQQQKNRGASHS